MKIILQKYISSSGYCSRRKAEELIRAGKVKVNGLTAKIADCADEGDTVEVEGRLIKRIVEEKIYILLNKPLGYTCTNRSFKGEKNVFELLEGFNHTRLFVVGRLDKNSRGLVILTNDGDFAEKMAHPRYEKEKEYEIKCKMQNAKTKMKTAPFEPPLLRGGRGDFFEEIKSMLKGIDIGGGDGIAKAKKAEYLGDGKFRIILAEGKKRQIRRMFKMLGLEVADLTRVRIGEYKLGSLKEREYRVTHNA
jgi:23S rRNA pseudouridine2605 synthase